MDINKNGIEPIEDNELDAVAGGYAPPADDIEALARSENRYLKRPLNPQFCGCGENQRIYARTGLSKPDVLQSWFVKCYTCGKTYDSYDFPR